MSSSEFGEYSLKTIHIKIPSNNSYTKLMKLNHIINKQYIVRGSQLMHINITPCNTALNSLPAAEVAVNHQIITALTALTGDNSPEMTPINFNNCSDDRERG